LNFLYHILLQADQRLAEWRNKIGNAALTALYGLFSEQGLDTDDARRAFAESVLDRYRFLYSQVLEGDGDKVRCKPLSLMECPSTMSD
jgi:hypothetical protein